MVAYVKSLRGLVTILELLKSAENEISEKGVVSEATQKYLYQVFGKSDISVARKIFMNCYFISEGKPLREGNSESNKSITDAEACKRVMIEELKSVHDHYDSMVASMEKYEQERNRVDRLVQCAPTDPDAQALQRQIIHLERQLYKDMDQLERLQRRRLGDAVPPPINLNVTSDIEPLVQ
jgi:predicted RNase H-like nuclease (RuvC/YqgF family)